MRRSLIILSAVAVLCVQAIQDDLVEREWKKFQVKFNKSYRSPVEQSRRFAIFREHLQEIEDHNNLYKAGKTSYREAINQFSDWTDEEFKEYVSHGLIAEGDILSSLSDDDEEIKENWRNFQETYRKSYRSPMEAKKRFEIFKNNFIKMKEHNGLFEQGLVSDILGINQFSDWTQEEFRDYVNKGILPSDDNIIRRWEDFKEEFNKSYKTIYEAEKRFNIFKANVKLIDENNALYDKGEVSFYMGINQFTDWTHEEYEEWVRTH